MSMTAQEKNAFPEKKHQRNGMDIPIECIRLCPENSKSSSKSILPHYHDYIEFLFGLTNCDAVAWVAGEEVPFGEGDLVIVNSYVAHDCVCRQPSNYICIKILPEVIHFSENSMYDVKYVLPFLQHDLLPYQFFDRSELKGSQICDTVKAMMEHWTQQEYGYEIALKSLFLQIFLWIIRYNHAHNRTPMEPAADISYENIRLIQKSMDYIHENFADIGETEAAAYVNMSYSYYSRLFRRVVGKNFNDYLTTVRINAAERMLLTSSRSITEIAHATGFATSSHFIDKFRKCKNTTPKQYRMRWQKQN